MSCGQMGTKMEAFPAAVRGGRCLSCGSGRRIYSSVREREESGVALKQGEPLVIIPARGRESVAGVEIIASFPSPLLFGEHLRFRPWSNIKRQRNSKRAQTPF